MVVGAYTIINTIGLLSGLPLSMSSTNISRSIDINHNAEIIGTNQDQYFVILDTKNSSSFTFQPGTSYTLTLNFQDNAEIYALNTSLSFDNYLVYAYDSGENITKPYTLDISFEGLNFGSNNLVINQVYLAKQTSSLSSIDGNSVISSITSGLGLMGDITTNFQNGFSSLIWNSEDNTLTTFGNFALIFLGVSITFAIVKLCLNLIRSKTGA